MGIAILTEFYRKFVQLKWVNTAYLRQKVLLGLLSLCCMSACSFALAKDWRVITEEAPPLQYITEQGVAGYSTSMVKQLLAEAKLAAEIEVMPWARGFDLAAQRKNTLIYSMIRTPEREKKFDWIGRLGHFQLSFIGLKHRKGLKISSVNDAKNWVVGAIRDDYTHQFLKQSGFDSEQDLVVRSQLGELVDLLYKERIDTFIVDIELLKPMINDLGYHQHLVLNLMDIPGLAGDVYLAANPNSDAEMIDKLKAAYITLYGDEPLHKPFLIPE